MFSCDSRDRAKPVGRKSYVSMPEGRLTTGNRANSSGVKSGSSTWTRVVIQRYTVEMLVGESVSTRQPGSVRDQFDTAKVIGTYPLSSYVYSCTKWTHYAVAEQISLKKCVQGRSTCSRRERKRAFNKLKQNVHIWCSSALVILLPPGPRRLPVNPWSNDHQMPTQTWQTPWLVFPEWHTSMICGRRS